MKTIAINENNDIYLDNSGNLAIKTDLDAMGDICVNKSQTVQGELLFNQEKGIDFFNTIFSSPTYPDLFQNEVISQLEDTESVNTVNNFKGEASDGIYSYTTKIQTDFGQVVLNG